VWDATLQITITQYKITISNTKTKRMTMWGNHIQRIKNMINVNNIEQVTDFKCLGHRTSEYKSDLKTNCKHITKINGAIKRNFAKN